MREMIICCWFGLRSAWEFIAVGRRICKLLFWRLFCWVIGRIWRFGCHICCLRLLCGRRKKIKMQLLMFCSCILIFGVLIV